MSRREFLLLADTYKADKHEAIGMIASEKLDGMRALWDGGVSRGDKTVNVPWASLTNPKTGERKDKIREYATGLWSRYGSPIQAPDWFLDQLPGEPVDGELYMGRNRFQETMSTVRKDVPIDEEWKRISYAAFAAPTCRSLFQDGLIKNPNMLETIDERECSRYILQRGFGYTNFERTYIEELTVLDELASSSTTGDVFEPVHAEYIDSMVGLDTWLTAVTDFGGEGLMIRDPDSVWFPKRRPFLLKVKPRHDAEATIVGFVAGKKGKTGHLVGKVGTLQCVWHGDPTASCGLLKQAVPFEIGTGLTRADREIEPLHSFEQACANPGRELIGVTDTGKFKVGDRVTFTYMGVTKDLKPREPSYLRFRENA